MSDRRADAGPTDADADPDPAETPAEDTEDTAPPSRETPETKRSTPKFEPSEAADADADADADVDADADAWLVAASTSMTCPGKFFCISASPASMSETMRAMPFFSPPAWCSGVSTYSGKPFSSTAIPLGISNVASVNPAASSASTSPELTYVPRRTASETPETPLSILAALACAALLSPSLATRATTDCPTAAPSVPMPSMRPESDETSPGAPAAAAASPRSTDTAVPYMCAGPPEKTPTMMNAAA